MMTHRLFLGALIGLSAGIILWALAWKPAPPAARAHDSENLRPRPARPSSSGVVDDSPLPDERIDSWLRRAGRDTPATLTDILALPDKDVRNELLDWVISAWTTETREPALEWLEKTLPSMTAESAAETQELLIGSWALTDPHEAMNWVTNKLSDPRREAGLKIVASSWALADPTSMGRWIREVSPAPDFWTEELIQALISTDPTSAMDWCDHLANPELATETREGVILSWQLSAPEEAAEWLKKHPGEMPVTQAEETPRLPPQR